MFIQFDIFIYAYMIYRYWLSDLKVCEIKTLFECIYFLPFSFTLSAVTEMFICVFRLILIKESTFNYILYFK